MFDENSGVVRTWVSVIRAGLYDLDDVPSLSNLKEVVSRIISGTGKMDSRD